MPDFEFKVSPELTEAAELALSACQILGWADALVVDSVEPEKEAVIKLFTEFSDADLAGLQTMIDDLAETTVVFRRSREPGADVDALIRELGELRAGVEATHRLISEARTDLTGLARSFHADAVRYCMTKASGDSATTVFRSFFDQALSLRKAVRKAAEGVVIGQSAIGNGPIVRSA
ncbi:hypothetical protein LWC34_49500 [Kibdelosporangium philippinense]|uniref:Uncharacterized protein n=1 Tax=Kibdelosporangium philippinense TaxID=211113 RepID=A0ABS8ZSY4_9PSEU|nr:hypothetical protein [Kibdelosporangium philippinense]MCE7010787.1 hypothetical protein [Kibdelosporangium philippinense]